MCYSNIVHMITEKRRQKILLWFAKQPWEIQLDIFKMQRDLFFQMKGEGTQKPAYELTLESFIQAVYEAWKTENFIHTKETDHQIEKIRQKIMTRIRRHKVRTKKKKKSTKQELLEQHAKELMMMKQEKLSLRQMADYLEKYCKIKASHTTINRFLKSI